MKTNSRITTLVIALLIALAVSVHQEAVAVNPTPAATTTPAQNQQQVVTESGVSNTLQSREKCSPECKNEGICFEKVCYCKSPYGGAQCQEGKYRYIYNFPNIQAGIF